MELQLHKILVPIDFSENAKSALRYASQLAGLFHAEIILIHVLEPMLYPPDFSLGQIILPSIDTHEIEDKANEELQKLAEIEVAKDLKKQVIVKSGKPFAEIIQIAKEENIDLIIISSHGHSGMEQIIFGSTSEKVVRKAPCPVLTVRDPLKGFDYKEALLNS